jgi:hypothetical protein
MADLRKSFAFLALLLIMFLLPGLTAALQDEPPAPVAEVFPQRIEDFERRFGPFDVSGQQFRVILRMKRVVTGQAVVDPDFGETLTGIEIQDAQGVIHYQNSFAAAEVSEGRFVETTVASVMPARGRLGNGLLITFGSLPSTPLGGSSWQVFGLLEGRLTQFNKPLYLEGDLVNAGGEEQVVQASQEPNLQGDVLHFRVWTGNFFAIIPLKIDWLLGTFARAWQCRKMTPQGLRPLCQVRVETDRVPQEEDMTFVRLYSDPESLSSPAHVVVRKDSEVEFLGAETEVIWDEDANGVGLSVSGDVWLKLRIDGKEGWIHTQEDFTAIGLPQAG